MIRKKLDSVEKAFANDILERGAEVKDMNVKYIFAKDEYIGTSHNFKLMTRKEAIRLLTDNALKYLKEDSLTDDEYEKYFRASVETDFSIFATEIDLPFANKQHYVLTFPNKMEDK